VIGTGIVGAACAHELAAHGLDVLVIERADVHLGNGEVIATGAVLVANGLQAVDLMPRLPLQAKKGHLLITDRYPGTICHQILELGYIKSAHNASGTSVAFNVQPRPTGQLLIGPAGPFAEDGSHPSTWLATGHESLGVTTALGTAKSNAAQMLGHDAEIDAKPYLPARFAALGAIHV
jgi:glycine/D-amino acid oxidase-like deaminating enzyme